MKQEFIENIEAYLASEITYDALKSIADKGNIIDLDEKIEWVRNTILAVEADGLRDQLKTILPQNVKKEAKVKTLTSFKFFAGIAASLFILIIAYWGIQDNNVTINQYAQFEYSDPGLPVTMSASDDYALYDALTYYGEEDYKKCIQKLEAIDGERSDTIAYYLGASYYYVQDYLEAINLLNFTPIANSVFSEQAEWLLILSYLKSDQKGDALPILMKIKSAPNHKFYNKAKDLINKLESQ